MQRPIQLHIPTPCHEDWASMRPAEQGRHCQSCQKTVVDFSTMSDQQVINYLAKAGPHICGRLASDQMNRSFIPLAPPQRNGWSGWRLLLAGALITSTNPPLKPDLPEKPAIHCNQQPNTNDGIMGMLMIPDSLQKYQDIDTARILLTEIRPDSSSHLTGVITMVPDSLLLAPGTLRDPVIMADSTKSNPTLPDSILPAKGFATDTLQNITTSLRSLVTDTLTALHPLPKTKWQVYPNPLPRGTSLHLTWQTAPGRYQITLLSATGALIRERTIEVGGPGQVDVWNIGSGIPAGIYILRAVRPGQAEALTRELVLE